jgi:hypothetical protein
MKYRLETILIALCLLAAQPALAQQIKTGPYQSVGASQYGLAVSTNTTLTVPLGTICAYITVETANVRRTADGTSASTTVGTLFTSGTQWTDCGPLGGYKFTAVSGSPTLDVEYYK